MVLADCGILITAYIPIQSANERLESNTLNESNVTALSIVSFGMFFLYVHKKFVSIDAQANLTFTIAIFVSVCFSHKNGSCDEFAKKKAK